MEQITALLDKLPHYKKVIFAVYCCNDVKHLMNPESLKCLELLEKWIEDNYSVSMEELRGAATYMYAATAAGATAYAAATADVAAYAAAAYAAAAYAANATADVAAAVRAAAYAAAYAAGAHNYNAKINENKLIQYEMYLLKMIDELMPLEKEFI